MALSIRHRLASSSMGMFDRPDSSVRVVKKVVFISAEGKHTEKDYFEHLQSVLESQDDKLPVVIHVLRHEKDCCSDPSHVFELLEECSLIRKDDFLFEETKRNLPVLFTDEKVYAYFKNPEKLPDDERKEFRSELIKAGISVDYYQWLRQIGNKTEADVFAVVLERDTHSHQDVLLEEIYNKCQERGFRFCLTNPCFEFWLLLHLCDVGSKATERQKHFLQRNKKLSNNHTYVSYIVSSAAHHGKSISRGKFENVYFPNMKVACERAKSFATTFKDVVSSVGTTLPDFIEEIMGLVVAPQ